MVQPPAVVPKSSSRCPADADEKFQELVIRELVIEIKVKFVWIVVPKTDRFNLGNFHVVDRP